jgi:hypothetical protein
MHISLGRRRSHIQVRQPLSPLGKVVACILFTLIGLGMLVGAYFLSASTRHFLQVAKRTSGEVTEILREKRSSGTGSKRQSSTVYFPEIRFTTDNGIPVVFRGSSGGSSPTHHVGQRVEVLYDPAAPHDASLSGWFHLWGPAVIVGVMGAVFLLLGTLPALFVGAVLMATSKPRQVSPPPPPNG